MSRSPEAAAAQLAETIRRERRALGLSQEELALVAGLGLRAVSDIEAGKATAWLATWVSALDALGLELVAQPCPPPQPGSCPGGHSSP